MLVYTLEIVYPSGRTATANNKPVLALKRRNHMKIKMPDLVDFQKVDALLEGFNKSTGFVTAILDLEGTVLSKSGWRQICTEFHRIHPETCRKCNISDTVLARKMAAGEKYHFYTESVPGSGPVPDLPGRGAA
jgi:hypothetical protein